MVNLTPTLRIRNAIEAYNALPSTLISIESSETLAYINHQTLHTVYTELSATFPNEYTSFFSLLQGTDVYTPPPPPAPKKTPEYEALMKRLRGEAEEREYRKLAMPVEETPTAETEEMSWNEVKSQITVIFNVLLSTFATAAAVWKVASGLDVPERLATAFVSALVVLIAEVVLFMGYIRRLDGAKKVNGTEKNVDGGKAEVLRTWQVGGTHMKVF
ncbi:endoplasmic reticulum-based factor for assembly of V-ATPase-domain-containing protein [Geopyxis carbonaria]|nr:endoplasmic reticulum-based factor for assembly of V-ATPase-domain-containing protein [Geopyxis carbonaria]